MFVSSGVTIASQPAATTNYAGTTASFTVVATAPAPLFYQWYFGTNLLSGQTNSTLSVPSVGPSSVGYYRVVISSLSGTTNSVPALLTVLYQAPNIVGGQMLPGANAFQLTFSGPTGQTFKVLATDDLTLPLSSWTVLNTGTFIETNALFIDNDVLDHPHRYYLVESP
jgi:hypothetical protein